MWLSSGSAIQSQINTCNARKESDNGAWGGVPSILLIPLNFPTLSLLSIVSLYRWYFLFVPIGAVAWSGLFNPHYFDLPIMAAHGVLGYLVSWQFSKGSTNLQMNNFLAAMAVTFSAGIISRFTGRQALGNTVAGLYVLLPGAYLVTQVYSDRIDGFLWQIILRAIIIGIGGWTGTILCTPTLLGINKGLMDHTKAVPTLVENASDNDSRASNSSIRSGQHFRRRDKGVRRNGTGALLFF